MRDMQKELSLFRQRKAAREEEKASKCLRKPWQGVVGSGGFLGQENNLFTFAEPPRKGCKPSTRSETCRRHVKSESPLMEMCQNGTRKYHTRSPASIRRPGLATVAERFRNDGSPRQSQTYPGNSHDFVDFPAEDLQRLLKELQEAKDEVGVVHDEDVHEVESQQLDEDDHARTLQRLREHKPVEWGPPIHLDGEDFLSRAYNWDLFLFFEKRERCPNYLGDNFEKLEDRCAEIYEYNPEWPQWQRKKYDREVALEDQRYREACARAGSVCY